MRRISKILAVTFVIAGCLPAAALAASPTATTGDATSVSETSTVLHARVNPNGVSTGTLFQYGPTANLGLNSATHSIGAGKKTIDLTQALDGLTPGTIYYYRIVAESKAGVAYGSTRHFTTTGPPPPGVVTGTALNVGKTSATPTGTINGNGGKVDWQIQFGLTTGYGLANYVTPLTPVAAVPLAVALPLRGLAPATLFHYRVVAYPAAGSPVVGDDATFFTEPAVRPVPRFSVRTSPGSDKKAPFTFTTSGTLAGATFIPAIDRCTGKVGVRFSNGKHQLSEVVAPVGGDCKFNAQASFRHTRAPGKSAVPVKVTIHFRGNGYIAPVTRVEHVTAR